MNKYERVYNWTINEINTTVETYPIDQNIKDWLKILKESMEYNLNKNSIKLNYRNGGGICSPPFLYFVFR